METLQKTEREQIHEERERRGVDVDPDVGRTGIEGAAELQSELDSLADSTSVSGFTCAHEKCGLKHGHSTNKHRSSDSTSMSSDETAEMEANPNCHCGLNELAKRGHDEAPSPSRANDQAPIPEQMSTHLDASV